MHARGQLHALQLQSQRLTMDVEGGKVFEVRPEVIRRIAGRTAAQHGDVERRVIEQILQLAGEVRTVLGAISRGHAAQIEIVGRSGVVTGVAGLEKAEDRTLGSVAAERVSSFGGRSLRVQSAGEQHQCQREF